MDASNRTVTFQIVRHFPLNHACWRKSTDCWYLFPYGSCEKVPPYLKGWIHIPFEKRWRLLKVLTGVSKCALLAFNKVSWIPNYWINANKQKRVGVCKGSKKNIWRHGVKSLETKKNAEWLKVCWCEGMKMNEDWIHLELGPGGLSKCYNLYIYIYTLIIYLRLRLLPRVFQLDFNSTCKNHGSSPWLQMIGLWEVSLHPCPKNNITLRKKMKLEWKQSLPREEWTKKTHQWELDGWTSVDALFCSWVLGHWCISSNFMWASFFFEWPALCIRGNSL